VLNFGTSPVPLTSALVPGLTFPFDIKQSVNMVLFAINYRFFGGAPRF
jgi:hypothetical protein